MSFNQIIPGVSVEVHFGGSMLHVRNDGFLAGIKAEGTAVVTAYVDPGMQVFACHVDRRKDVVRKQKKDSTDPRRSDHSMFRVNMGIQRGAKQRNLYIAYPLNHFRMFTISQTGEVKFWEIAIVAQEERFFLSIQDTGMFQAYQDQDTVVWPDTRMASWPSMCQMLEKGLKALGCELPMYEEQTVAEPELPNDLDNDEGMVLWYNVAQGWGAAHTNQGLARVHWSEVPDEGTLRCLFDQDYFFFDELEVLEEESTAFPYEVRGIDFGEDNDSGDGDDAETTVEVETKVVPVPVTETGATV